MTKGDTKVVTQGTNEGGSNKKRSFDNNREGYSNRSKNYGEKKNFQRRPEGGRPEGARPEGRERRFEGKREGGFEGKNNRFEGKPDNRYGKQERYDKNKSFMPKFSGKDEDEEDYGRRSRPSRPRESKPSIAIPDKDKTMLRLEKEQKTMKKKQQQSKKKESNRPQQRVKRANNINYTRSYANGDFDDYDYDDF